MEAAPSLLGIILIVYPSHRNRNTNAGQKIKSKNNATKQPGDTIRSLLDISTTISIRLC